MKTKSNVSTHELTYLYNVIIKQQPEVVAFHNGNVVSPVWTTGEKKKKYFVLALQCKLQSPRSYLHTHGPPTQVFSLVLPQKTPLQDCVGV